MWAFLCGIHDAPFETGVKAHLKAMPNLVAYLERIRAAGAGFAVVRQDGV